MKLNTLKTNKSKGFTLIEMIGVLAVIAILAAVLIPKVFEAINSSRVNSAAMGCQTMKTAIVDHYAKYGSLLVAEPAGGGTPVPFLITDAEATQFDTVLLQEQLVDKLFQTKISEPPLATQTRVSLLDLSGVTVGATATGVSAAVTPTAAGDSAFDLNGDGDSDISGSVVAVALMTGVTLNDAYELSKRLDGDAMSAATPSTDTDAMGRVKYTFNDGTDPTATGTVYVYLTHR